jgi:5-methylcytosine-specific restriction endonuclease McrA
MTRASKLCNFQGCAELIPLSKVAYCPAHLPVLEHGWDTSTRKKPPNWMQIRNAVLRGSRYRCGICGNRASIVDHVRPQAWGGDEKPSNLWVLCGKHHRIKTNMESRLGRDMAKIPPGERENLIHEFVEEWRPVTRVGRRR